MTEPARTCADCGREHWTVEASSLFGRALCNTCFRKAAQVNAALDRGQGADDWPEP